MRQNTTEGDRGADQSVQLLIATNGKLEVAWGDTLDLEVLGSILIEWLERRDSYRCHEILEDTYARKFEYLGCEVFEDSCYVHGSFGAHAHLVLGVVLEKTLDTTAGKLIMTVSAGITLVNARRYQNRA